MNFFDLLALYQNDLEAMLVVGILLTYLVKINREPMVYSMYWGALVGVILSTLVGVANHYFDFAFINSLGNKFLDGSMMVVNISSVIYLTYWIQYKSKGMNAKGNIHTNTIYVVLFILPFISFFRAGMQWGKFGLTQSNLWNVILGDIIGITLAVIVVCLVYIVAGKFNLQMISKILLIDLIFIGGELTIEELLRFFNMNDENFEMVAMGLFVLPLLCVFMKDDIKKYWRKTVNRKEKSF